MNIKNVVVAGGGVLGSQIAYQTAFSGFNVKVWLRSEGSIERAKPKFDRLKNIYLETLEEMKSNPATCPDAFPKKDSYTDEEIERMKEDAIKAHDSIVLTTSYEEAFNDCDLVIEAIAEIPKEKVDFYTELAKHLPERSIIATNSSTLLPSMFAEYTGRPEKYLALHFANNIWRNNTAEVMGHEGTGSEYYNMVADFAEKIGMVALKLKKEQPGYILNSLLVPFLSAAEALLANDVADHETIDRTWKLATRAPMGPFEILDIVGLTTAYNIVSLNPESKNPDSIPGKISKLLKSYIDEGKTGINAGEGFYKY